MLNSRLIETSLRQTCTRFRGGYLNCEIRFIRDLPINLPTAAADKKHAERITESVRAVMNAKAALRQPKLSDGEKNRLDAAVEATRSHQ